MKDEVITARTVLHMVENFLLAQKNSFKVMTGIYLKEKDTEIFITIGQCKLITIFAKGSTELFLEASRHSNMQDAEWQAKNFIEQIYEVLDEVVKR